MGRDAVRHKQQQVSMYYLCTICIVPLHMRAFVIVCDALHKPATLCFKKCEYTLEHSALRHQDKLLTLVRNKKRQYA